MLATPNAGHIINERGRPMANSTYEQKPFLIRRLTRKPDAAVIALVATGYAPADLLHLDHYGQYKVSEARKVEASLGDRGRLVRGVPSTASAESPKARPTSDIEY